MKTTEKKTRLAVLAVWFAVLLPACVAKAEDLVTRNGTVYHGYKVLSHDAGYLTIMYSEGGGKIPLSDLPDDLQKKYGYNKAQAEAFVQSSVAQDRQDRQAIADEQAQHQQQAAARAQALASTAAASAPAAAASPPTVSGTPPATAGASPHLPAYSSVPLAAMTPGARSSPIPASQADIDDTRQKIKDLVEDIIGLKTEMKGTEGSGDPYVQKLSTDQKSLLTLQNQLKDMEASQPPKKMTWDDIAATHEQIVVLLDDVSLATPDVTSTDMSTHLRSQSRIASDQAQIAELRREIKIAIKDPFNLSPDDLAALRQKISETNPALLATPSPYSSNHPYRPPSHEENEAEEKQAEMVEQLQAALQPPK